MDRAVDILHPLASLEWREWRGPPVNVGGAHAVWLKDKVYVGGGGTLGSLRDHARLYIYTPTTDTWDTPIDTPVCWFALTTYRSQLVLIGGREYVSGYGMGEPTKILWTLSEHGQWQETLPPMPTPCTFASAVSHGDHLLVISSDYSVLNNHVYVYNGHHWASAQHPPQQLLSIKSTIFNGHWYLMGGRGGGGPYHSQETNVYSASLDSLIASYQPSETSQPSSVWKRLPDVPVGYCYPVVFGNRLIAVGGGLLSTTTSIHVYSSFTQSWARIGDISLPSSYAAPCAIVLSSNELMVVRGQRALKVTIKMTPFNPESPFNKRALSLLEPAAGIPVMSTLSDYTRHIQNILGPMTSSILDLNPLINYWISDILHIPPTWKNVLLIIRLLNLDDLAQRMESYLSGAMKEISPVRGDGNTEAKLRLQEEMIFDLKQQMATMQQRIEDLKYENEELKSRHSLAPIKEEVEEKPVALLPVKTELKEEAVTMTKAETMSAQPTTATWSLRGADMCGEMSVVVYSSHYQQITWEGFGLKLHIQEGSLPAGMAQCILQIKASLAGQYEFPENSHLVSAIFWLRCETVRKFTKPITVEIQHCAKSENIRNLKFIRGICSQKQLPYTFKQLPEGNFTSRSSYGVIELNSFSGVGITQEGSEDREYCSQLFYLGQPSLYKIHFVVTWNIEAHLTVVKQEYKDEKAVLGLHQLVEFESDAISLDIPLEGITIKGWKITPLIRPVVTKKQVDNFREGKVTPCCQLKAEVSGRRKKIPTLKHQVTLQGAKYPHNIFTIDLPAEDPNPQSGTKRSQTFGDLASAGPPPTKKGRFESDESAFSTDPIAPTPISSKALSTDSEASAGPSKTVSGLNLSSSGLDTKLDLDHHFHEATQFLVDLEERHICDVGGALGLTYNVLVKMKHCPNDMVAAWLRREKHVMIVSGEPTWRTLVEALSSVGQEGIAENIKQKKDYGNHD